jgi:uncharacterized membrane protein
MLHVVLMYIQKTISFIGVLILLSGALYAVYEYGLHFFKNDLFLDKQLNLIRLRLGRVLILGLEFIIAADIIGTTTTPDYYSLGILALIVVIRTLLSLTLNRELDSLRQQLS